MGGHRDDHPPLPLLCKRHSPALYRGVRDQRHARANHQASSIARMAKAVGDLVHLPRLHRRDDRDGIVADPDYFESGWRVSDQD